MFKTKPVPAKPAIQRLHKAAIKRARANVEKRAKFLKTVSSTTGSAETQAGAQQLVSRVRAAATADFLQKYRISA